MSTNYAEGTIVGGPPF